MAIKIGLDGFPPFFSAAARFLIASTLLFIVMKLKGIDFPRNRQYLVQTCVLGTSMYFIPYAFVYWGEQFISSGLSAVLFASHTLFVVIFAHLLLPDEPVSVRKVVGLLLGFSGIVLAFQDNLGFAGSLGIVSMTGMILGAASGGFALVWLKRMEADYHPLHMVTSQMAFTAVVFLMVSLCVERRLPLNLSWKHLLSLLHLSVIGSAVAFVIYYWLVKNVAAVKVSFVLFVTPLVALFLGWLVLGEAISLNQILGGLLVAAGIRITISRSQV